MVRNNIAFLDFSQFSVLVHLDSHLGLSWLDPAQERLAHASHSQVNLICL